PPQPPQAQLLSFGPPYYGRPPTPLPPSPSLTSLLRPSRPTTPDASDDEHGHGDQSSLGNNSNSNNHRPVPRASPEVPTYEYYGFVLYLFSSCCFLMYLLWSYLPSPFLHALGIHYYPDRWWSLAVPSFIVVLLVYIYVALALYNTEYLTLPLGSLETIVDDAGKIAVVDGRGRIGSGNGFVRERGPVDWRECWNEGTDAVMDVPLAGVCEILYGGAGLDGDED
ncbi:PIG-P-domain-containing protein, partial [Coniella lustricola]